MKRIVIDTNVVVSFLTDRDLRQQELAARLFQDAAAGSCEILLHQTVISELVYVLRNLYKQTPQDVAETIRELSEMPGVSVMDEMPWGICFRSGRAISRHTPTRHWLQSQDHEKTATSLHLTAISKKACDVSAFGRTGRAAEPFASGKTAIVRCPGSAWIAPASACDQHYADVGLPGFPLGATAPNDCVGEGCKRPGHFNPSCLNSNLASVLGALYNESYEAALN